MAFVSAIWMIFDSHISMHTHTNFSSGWYLVGAQYALCNISKCVTHNFNKFGWSSFMHTVYVYSLWVDLSLQSSCLHIFVFFFLFSFAHCSQCSNDPFVLQKLQFRISKQDEQDRNKKKINALNAQLNGIIYQYCKTWKFYGHSKRMIFFSCCSFLNLSATGFHFSFSHEQHYLIISEYETENYGFYDVCYFVRWQNNSNIFRLFDSKRNSKKPFYGKNIFFFI